MCKVVCASFLGSPRQTLIYQDAKVQTVVGYMLILGDWRVDGGNRSMKKVVICEIMCAIQNLQIKDTHEMLGVAMCISIVKKNILGR